jgi:hypothetical protein
MEGSDRTCEDTEDTTMLVQIEETKWFIRKMSYVTTLSPVRVVNGMGPGWQISLSSCGYQEYISCPRNQESVVRLSLSSMRSVRISHETSRTSLIIVVRLHTFKTFAQFLSVLELRNSVLPVKIILGLIRKLDMTESVFETLTSITIMHETETNTNNTIFWGSIMLSLEVPLNRNPYCG